MTKESTAVCGREGVQGIGEGCDQVFQGARRLPTQMRFEFGKGQFDGIEIRTVRRQVAKLDALGLERRRNALNFVRGEIVQDQRVSGLQTGNEHLLEVDQEDFGVHRAIDQKRGGDLFLTERRQKGGTLPTTVRYGAHASFTAGTATVQASQLGVEAGFINKDQTRCVPIGLLAPPKGARTFNVGAVLLGGARRFFYNATLSDAGDARGP